MAFKSTVRERFGTGLTACGEFGQPVESVFSGHPEQAANALNTQELRFLSRWQAQALAKSAVGGKLVSDGDDFLRFFGR